MTRSPKATEALAQVSIDDFDLGVEYIPGGMPPRQQDVDRERAIRDEALRAGYHVSHLGPPVCLPEQRIHVYAGAGPCQCKEIK